METFTAIKAFVDNPTYLQQRQNALQSLNIAAIDTPIVDIIRDFSKLPCCFTLQCCYGHFLHCLQQDPYSTEPLRPSDRIEGVDYKIAYLALCIENSTAGMRLFNDLKMLVSVDPDYVQFGCAEWFWRQQVNSYALQIEPYRYRNNDKVQLGMQEALHVQAVRDRIFTRIRSMLSKHKNGQL